ncbi:thioredoxin domain-containing protein [Candidatus Vidania fulgoroideorum]
MYIKIFKGEYSVIEFIKKNNESCFFLQKEIKKITQKYNIYIEFLKSYIDDDPSVVKKFSITRLPTLIFFKGSFEVYRTTGYRKKETISFLIEKKLLKI